MSGVFPAHAGMSLQFTKINHAEVRFPRPRGDELLGIKHRSL